MIGALPGLTSVFVIYQDPLAYLLGLEGIALLDAWAGDHDREFTQTRLAEIRRLQDDEKLRAVPGAVTAVWGPARSLAMAMLLVSLAVAGLGTGLLVLALPRPGGAGKIAA